MPPCKAMPFTIAPIACSRMPKAMLRPACVAAKTPPPLNSVFVDSTRSAAPPTIVGVKGLNASIVLRAGVARRHVLAGREVGQRLDPAGPRLARVHLVPVLAQRRVLRRPGVDLRRPRLLELGAARDPVHVLAHVVGDEEVLVRVPAERDLRRAHLVLAERRAVRLRRVHRVRRAVGDVRADDDQRRPAPSRPSPFAIASRSESRSFASSTCWTCQPCAASRSPRSSAVNESEVVPSIVMWLSS